MTVVNNVVERVEFTGSHLVVLAWLRLELATARFGLFSPEHCPWMNDHLYEQIVTETAIGGRFDAVHIQSVLLSKIDIGRLHDRGLLGRREDRR